MYFICVFSTTVSSTHVYDESRNQWNIWTVSLGSPYFPQYSMVQPITPFQPNPYSFYNAHHEEEEDESTEDESDTDSEKHHSGDKSVESSAQKVDVTHTSQIAGTVQVDVSPTTRNEPSKNVDVILTSHVTDTKRTETVTKHLESTQFADMAGIKQVQTATHISVTEITKHPEPTQSADMAGTKQVQTVTHTSSNEATKQVNSTSTGNKKDDIDGSVNQNELLMTDYDDELLMVSISSKHSSNIDKDVAHASPPCGLKPYSNGNKLIFVLILIIITFVFRELCHL